MSAAREQDENEELGRILRRLLTVRGGVNERHLWRDPVDGAVVLIVEGGVELEGEELELVERLLVPPR